MDILSKFSENLIELINDEKITYQEFANAVEIDLSEIYRYIRKEYLPKLSNIIKIADRYNYSIDYLIGEIPFPVNAVFKKTPPFCETFKALLKERNVSRYALSKQLEISINGLDDWYKGKYIPSLNNAIKLKNYFDITLDKLFGREN